ncbi:flagellar motor switch protein FliG [Gracilinema caldarium]|uniref:flagellar motor switch protein FliG n=1 Tax=Gracilinema caldarium TaxID=215591 RepID=UPI0026F1E773|nr:flagellar motor switch protein FliG [Gracilinema caldarium]
MAQDQRPVEQRRLAAYLKNTANKNNNPLEPDKKETEASPVSKQSLSQPRMPKPPLSQNSGAQPPRSETAQAQPHLSQPQRVGFQKTVKEPAQTGKEGESKYRKVAKLLIVIGQKEASAILSKLEPEQIEAITKEIAAIRTVSHEEGEAILAEFRALFSQALRHAKTTAQDRGGIDVARSLLAAAFGKEKGETLLRRAVPDAIENPFQFLEDFSPEQIVLLLKDEPAPVLALVLARLSAPKAAACIKNLSKDQKLEVVKRLAKMGKTSPEVIEKVAEVLRERAHKMGKTETTEVDGKAVLAAILRHADPSLGDEILENLEDINPELSRDIKEKLYTLDDVVRCDDRALQEKLRTMEDRDIALLLKGQEPEFIDKIKSNLSANRRTLVEEERTLLGPVPRKETEEVVQNFLSWFRTGRENGTILLVDDSDILV